MSWILRISCRYLATLHALIITLLLCGTSAKSADAEADPSGSSTWAVIVDASRFWTNYRHYTNALSFYRTLKRLGVPDRQIILFLGDDAACDRRNVFQGSVFNAPPRRPAADDLYAEDIEVDFRGAAVTVDNFLRLLTGRQHPSTPRNQRLLSDRNSNLFIYVTGHGGNGFLKFRDYEELLAEDLANAIETLYQQGRYKNLLFVGDSCEIDSLPLAFYSPRIFSVVSSMIGESSWSAHNDETIGLSLVDNWTYSAYVTLREKVPTPCSDLTLQDFFDITKRRAARSRLKATPVLRSIRHPRPPSDVRIVEFLANPQTAVCGKRIQTRENNRLSIDHSDSVLADLLSPTVKTRLLGDEFLDHSLREKRSPKEDDAPATPQPASKDKRPTEKENIAEEVNFGGSSLLLIFAAAAAGTAGTLLCAGALPVSPASSGQT